MIVFSREMTGAIKRRVEDPPTQGGTPPNDDDPFHPDQQGDVDDEMLSGDEPEDSLDDDNQPDYNIGPDPDDDDDNDDDDGQEYIIPDDHGPPPDDDSDIPGIQDSGETHQPSSPSTPFSNPDIPIEEIADPGQDDDSPPGPDPTSESIRVQRKQRQISTDSTDALPKAKAKVIIKRPKVQLPGHVKLHYTTLTTTTATTTTATLYAILDYTTQHYPTLHYTTFSTPPQMQLQLRYTNYITPQLQLHYTTITATAWLHHATSSSCG